MAAPSEPAGGDHSFQKLFEAQLALDQFDEDHGARIKVLNGKVKLAVQRFTEWLMAAPHIIYDTGTVDEDGNPLYMRLRTNKSSARLNPAIVSEAINSLPEDLIQASWTKLRYRSTHQPTLCEVLSDALSEHLKSMCHKESVIMAITTYKPARHSRVTGGQEVLLAEMPLEEREALNDYEKWKRELAILRAERRALNKEYNTLDKLVDCSGYDPDFKTDLMAKLRVRDPRDESGARHAEVMQPYQVALKRRPVGGRKTALTKRSTLSFFSTLVDRSFQGWGQRTFSADGMRAFLDHKNDLAGAIQQILQDRPQPMETRIGFKRTAWAKRRAFAATAAPPGGWGMGDSSGLPPPSPGM